MAVFPDIACSKGTVPESVEPNVSRYAFGDGYTQRVANGINNMPENWNPVWDYLTVAQRDEMVVFLKDHGGVTAFEWTPPGEVAARKYTCASWKFTPRSGLASYSGTAKFIEEFDL